MYHTADLCVIYETAKIYSKWLKQFSIEVLSFIRYLSFY